MSFAAAQAPVSRVGKTAGFLLTALLALAAWRTYAAFGDGGVAFWVNLLLWGSLLPGLPLAVLGVRRAHRVAMFSLLLLGVSSLGSAIMAIAGSLPLPPGLGQNMATTYYITTVIEAVVVAALCAGAAFVLWGISRQGRKQ